MVRGEVRDEVRDEVGISGCFVGVGDLRGWSLDATGEGIGSLPLEGFISGGRKHGWELEAQGSR